MAEGRRPGGLTALAVINFVLAGFSLLGIASMAAFFALRDMIPTNQMDPTQKEQIEAFREMGPSILILLIVMNLLSGILLLTSGIGYLQQKKILGRMLGNVYAVVSVIAGVVSGLMFRAELGGGFSLGTIIGLIYPILTLVLINTTFKDDLTN